MGKAGGLRSLPAAHQPTKHVLSHMMSQFPSGRAFLKSDQTTFAPSHPVQHQEQWCIIILAQQDLGCREEQTKPNNLHLRGALKVSLSLACSSQRASQQVGARLLTTTKTMIRVLASSPEECE